MATLSSLSPTLPPPPPPPPPPGRGAGFRGRTVPLFPSAQGILGPGGHGAGISEFVSVGYSSPSATVLGAHGVPTPLVGDTHLPPTAGSSIGEEVGSGTSSPLSSSSAAAFDLESLLLHFWSGPRVPPSPSPTSDSFGWWRGKVAGDHRSFAQVVSSPPRAAPSLVTPAPSKAMGDRGGRFDPSRGGRGQGRFDRGRGNTGRRPNGKEDVPQGSSNTGTGSGSGSENWDAAAKAGRQGRGEGNKFAGGGGGQGLQRPPPGAADQATCANCKMGGHIHARCPTIRCERCRKLGHIAELCQTVLPWECVAPMCGFQRPGQGFFYIPDDSTVKQMKEKDSTMVITVMEGEVTAREIELEFNAFFRDRWRCTARVIGPGQFSMRLPNSIEVDRAVYYGERMRMKTKEAMLKLSVWNATIGAKAALQKAWVRISNIPLDKRTESNVYFAGSLVGISLELDLSTLHKPEYVRLLIGCRDLDKLPETAEGCLGDHFYDFFYDIDKVVVGGPPKDNTTVTVQTSSGVPSPKRARTENASSAVDENSEDQNLGSQSDSALHGRSYCNNMEVTVEDSQTSDDSVDDPELFIDKLVRENEDAGNGNEGSVNKWLVPFQSGSRQVPGEQSSVPDERNAMISYTGGGGQKLNESEWPSLINVADVSEHFGSPLVGSPEYLVQSPISPDELVNQVVPEAEVETQVRMRSRTGATANMNVMEKNAVYSRKRNLEGLHKEADKEFLRMGANKMMVTATNLLRADTRRVPTSTGVSAGI